MKIRSENGSYTVEACLTLTFFLIVIYFLFLQVNTMILENVLQKATNNFAVEISGFSYILDRANLVYEAKDTPSINNAVNSGKEAYSSAADTYSKYITDSEGMGDLVAGLYSDPGGAASDLKSVGSSFKAFISAIKDLKPEDFKNLGKHTGVEIIKTGINAAISSFCTSKLKDGAYLPLDYNTFCETYRVENNEIKIGVDFMAGDTDNYTVFIWAECYVKAPVNIPGFDKRRVVKASYSPLWIKG